MPEGSKFKKFKRYKGTDCERSLDLFDLKFNFAKSTAKRKLKK